MPENEVRVQLTEKQILRFLSLIDSGKNRNWEWLVGWLRGNNHSLDHKDATPEFVLEFYEDIDDKIWKVQGWDDNQD